VEKNGKNYQSYQYMNKILKSFSVIFKVKTYQKMLNLLNCIFS